MSRPKGSKNKKKAVETPKAVEIEQKKPEIQPEIVEKPKVENVKIVDHEIVVEDDPRLPDKSLFRVDEAAQYFDVAARTIYLWIEHGILNAEKYGGTIRIPRISILGCRFKSRFNPMM